jgi:hypothetical protein
LHPRGTACRRHELHAARQPVEQREADLFLEIPDLAGQRRLGHAQAARRAPVMLLLADCHEIPQVPQLHTDTLLRSV